MKSLVAKLFLCFVIMSWVHAFSPSPSVVVQMAQHDTDREALRESTFILENGVLNAFFDAGYIVSSLPTTINKDMEETLVESVQVARDGYMSYVVFIDVFYRTYGITGDETVTLDDIESIDWKIVSTRDLSVLSEGTADNAVRMEGESDFVAMKRFSNDLGVEIKKIFDNK